MPFGILRLDSIPNWWVRSFLFSHLAFALFRLFCSCGRNYTDRTDTLCEWICVRASPLQSFIGPRTMRMLTQPIMCTEHALTVLDRSHNSTDWNRHVWATTRTNQWFCTTIVYAERLAWHIVPEWLWINMKKARGNLTYPFTSNKISF